MSGNISISRNIGKKAKHLNFEQQNCPNNKEKSTCVSTSAFLYGGP